MTSPRRAARTGQLRRHVLDLDVSRAGESGVSMVAEVFLPASLGEGSALLVSMAGGNVTRGYLDLGGESGGDANYARSLAARGHVVVALDPIGVNDSTIPADGFTVSVAAEADWTANAVAALRRTTLDGMDLGRLPVIGVGHSAGSMIIGATQGIHACFEAVALLGFGTAGLPDYVPDEILARLDSADAIRAAVPVLARELFGGAGYFGPQPDVIPGDVGRWIAAVRAPFPAMLGAAALLPGNVAAEVAEIATPVFVGISENDIVGPLHLAGTPFTSSPDVTVFMLPGATHEIFAGPNTGLLFERLAQWLPSALLKRPAPGKRETADPEPSERAAGGRFDLERVPLGSVLDDQEARAILDRVLPGMSTHKMIRFVRKMPFAKVIAMAAPDVDPAVITRLTGELAGLSPR
ncbi:MAG TPA: alpha/beta fold hydrolase [Pseudolysinimonas sp.]|nr:alpha/beta fold hydrolase [Pseudolysinimonas sp.]